MVEPTITPLNGLFYRARQQRDAQPRRFAANGIGCDTISLRATLAKRKITANIRGVQRNVA